MIYWVTTPRYAFTIQKHLAHFGKPITDRVSVVDYRFLQQRRLPVGVYLLSDIERLSTSEIRFYDQVAAGLIAEDCVVLNCPGRVKRRYELLTGLAAEGMNQFQVHRPTDLERCETFPVFLRGENDHAGSLTPLLQSPEELRSAIRNQSRPRFFFRDEQKAWRFFRSGTSRRNELLVTEFCDTSDADGVFRKYSSFFVKGTVVARHLFFGPHWMLKGPYEQREAQLQEERDYVSKNPHADQLQRIFEFANIDYGRIDYGLLNGRIQTWEINTNPMITAPSDARNVDRLPVQETFVPRFHAALTAVQDGVT